MGNRATVGLVQSRAAGRRMLQRDSSQGTTGQTDTSQGNTGQKKPPATAQRVVAFVIRKKGDRYIQDMRDYLATTRKGLEVYEVDNLDDIAAKAEQLAAQGGKLDRVLIISHGQRGGGGLGMKADNGQWEFVLPDKIKQWSQTGQAAKLQGAMASGSEVQVLGCYIGANHQAGEAIASAFGSTSRASRGQEMVGTVWFEANGSAVTSSKNVPKKEQERFRAWLLSTYATLRDANEAPNLSDDAAKLTYMTDLFDRSKGVIRSLYVEDPNNKQKITAGSTEAQDLEDIETPSVSSNRTTQFDAP